jgi:hypothetical protein
MKRCNFQLVNIPGKKLCNNQINGTCSWNCHSVNSVNVCQHGATPYFYYTLSRTEEMALTHLAFSQFPMLENNVTQTSVYWYTCTCKEMKPLLSSFMSMFNKLYILMNYIDNTVCTKHLQHEPDTYIKWNVQLFCVTDNKNYTFIFHLPTTKWKTGHIAHVSLRHFIFCFIFNHPICYRVSGC